MQYDPNIENGEYRICEPPMRRSLRNKADDYDKLYLIFRTRYIQLDRADSYLVTGFYEIKKDFEREESGGPIIYAHNIRFVSISDSIDITKQMVTSKAFRASFTSKNTRWKENLVEWISHLKEKKDQTQAYVYEIKRLKKVFEENEFQDRSYLGCESCEHNTTNRLYCPLIRRRSGKRMPEHPAHYMRNLDEFYKHQRLAIA